MRYEGVKFICDRCGAEQFIESGENGILKEEPKFHRFSFMKKTYICDDCQNEFEQMVNDFMEEFKNDSNNN